MFLKSVLENSDRIPSEFSADSDCVSVGKSDFLQQVSTPWLFPSEIGTVFVVTYPNLDLTRTNPEDPTFYLDMSKASPKIILKEW